MSDKTMTASRQLERMRSDLTDCRVELGIAGAQIERLEKECKRAWKVWGREFKEVTVAGCGLIAFLVAWLRVRLTN